MKNTILVVCTIINILVTIIALIFIFKVDVDWTGPLGDTFGGLLSPIIGGISIYFIYQTFKAQREQLEDQRQANALDKSSLLFSNLSQIIDDIVSDIKHLEYIRDQELQGKNSIKFTGIEALVIFTSMKFKDDGFLKDTLRLEDKAFLNALDLALSKVLYLIDMKHDFYGQLIPDHKNHIERKIRWMLKGYINHVLSIYSTVRLSLEVVRTSDHYNEESLFNTNYLISLYVNFESLMNQLKNRGYVSSEQVTCNEDGEGRGLNWYTDIDEESYRRLSLRTDYSYKDREDQ